MESFESHAMEHEQKWFGTVTISEQVLLVTRSLFNNFKVLERISDFEPV